MKAWVSKPRAAVGALIAGPAGALIAVSAAALIAAPAAAEVFVDVGVQRADYVVRIVGMPDLESTHNSLHLGVGARRDVGVRSSIGVRVELDEIDSSAFMAVRAFDYAYHFSERFAATVFLGAARLDLATPAFGYYGGAGIRFKDVMPSWDAALEFRYGDKVARDNLRPSDPGPAGFGNFHDVTSVSLYLSYRFGAGGGGGSASR